MADEAYCESEPHGAGFRCPNCKAPHRLDRKGRVPWRQCEGTGLVFNDLSRGPCIHRGEMLRTEPCQFCGGRDKLIPIFACNASDGPAPEVSETRWGHAQPRRETCGGCGSYEPEETATRS